MKKIIILLAILTLYAGQSMAGSTVNNNKATAKLASSCTISATDFSFGVLTTGVSNTTTGNFSSLCTKGSNYTITMTFGSNLGYYTQCGTQPNDCLRMARSDKTDYIPYYILLPNGRPAGNGYDGDPYYGKGTGTLQILPLTARTQTNLYPKPGSYSDTVISTITF